jgi:hypothetical protein
MSFKFASKMWDDRQSLKRAMMYWKLRAAGFIAAGVLCLPAAGFADTQSAKPADVTPSAHRTHKAAKKTPPPPLPSGSRGPVPQVPLDALPAVAPDVKFQDGQLTIVAPNSTLGDILRAVRKQTSAEIEVPSNANERVATSLGPAPPRDVMSDLLNGSHFNYILLGSPDNQNALVRVVLVAKTGPDTAESSAQTVSSATPATPAANAADNADASADTAEETVDESADQAATEADQTPPEQPGVKTPQQMLQEMQQRQLQMQQQQQQNGQTTAPQYPPPGGINMPQRPPIQPQTPQPQDQ